MSFFGLGAVSAAVMSSADSCILSASSMFTHNIYKAMACPEVSVFKNLLKSCFLTKLLRQANGRHLTVILRISIVVVAGIASAMAISINSVYGLSY